MKIPLWGKAGFLAVLLILVGCQQVNPPMTDVASTPVPPQATPTAATGVFVRLTAPDSAIKVGDTLEVGIQIDRIEDLMGAEVHLQFEPKLMQLVDAQPDEDGDQVAHGSFLQPDFVVINTGDNLSGVVDYAIAQMPPHTAVYGDGELLILRLKAISPGRSSITITRVVLADAAAQEIPIEMLIDTVTITVE